MEDKKETGSSVVVWVVVGGIALVLIILFVVFLK